MNDGPLKDAMDSFDSLGNITNSPTISPSTDIPRNDTPYNSSIPSMEPTEAVTMVSNISWYPTVTPSSNETLAPTSWPSASETAMDNATIYPTMAPTEDNVTSIPVSTLPSSDPTIFPSTWPSYVPFDQPVVAPTLWPNPTGNGTNNNSNALFDVNRNDMGMVNIILIAFFSFFIAAIIAIGAIVYKSQLNHTTLARRKDYRPYPFHQRGKQRNKSMKAIGDNPYDSDSDDSSAYSRTSLTRPSQGKRSNANKSDVQSVRFLDEQLEYEEDVRVHKADNRSNMRNEAIAGINSATTKGQQSKPQAKFIRSYSNPRSIQSNAVKSPVIASHQRTGSLSMFHPQQDPDDEDVFSISL